MKITDLRVRQIRDRMLYPYTNSLGKSLKDTWKLTILELHTDEGITGVLVSGMMDDICRSIIENQLKEMIVGEDPMDTERLWERMLGGEGGWRYACFRGEVVRSMSAVDTLLWDIKGKKLGAPLYRLLGGHRNEVFCYASGGHYTSLTSHKQEIDHLEMEMAEYVKMGFKAVKMRVGRDIAKDSERTKVVRNAIGPDVKLLFDFNTSCSYFGGVPRAIRFMRELEKFDPYWFEDPLLIDDLPGLKQVSEAVDSPIAAGETEQTIWGFRDLIVNRIVDILIPDATDMCGGVSQWMKIAAMAEAFHIPVAAHIGDLTHVHCVAAVPNGLIVEVFTPLDESRRRYEIDPVMKPNVRGYLKVPDRPGIGVRLNEDYIREHLV